MSSTGIPQAESLRQQLRQRAGDYYPELSRRDLRVDLLDVQQRMFSHGYRFRLGSGDESRQVFVKVPVDERSPRSGAANGKCEPSDRPRIVPVLPPREEARLEFDGLTAMAEHFALRQDPHLGTPRALDFLEGDAIVVEAIDGPTLSEAFRRAHRLRPRQAGDALPPVFRRVGTWLKTFHEMPPSGPVQARFARRDDVLDLFGRFLGYLLDACGPSRHLESLRGRFVEYAEAVLPADLPLAAGHGDFGLHNIFVVADHRVVGFDTLAYWRSPAWEDLAYFLLLLETRPPLFVGSSLTIPSATVAACRQAFLEGYFGPGEVPAAELRLFEILVVMDKWVSAVHSCRRPRGVRRFAKRGRLALQQGFFRARAARLLEQLCTAVSAPGPRRAPSPMETAHVR